MLVFDLAEREGFEPPGGYKPPTVFKTAALNRSATSPSENYNKDGAFAPSLKGRTRIP